MSGCAVAGGGGAGRRTETGGGGGEIKRKHKAEVAGSERSERAQQRKNARMSGGEVEGGELQGPLNNIHQKKGCKGCATERSCGC